MEKTFLPLIKQFSSIEGLQAPYTLIYSLDMCSANDCRLTLCRTGSEQRIESLYLAAAPEYCYRLLQFLSENAVQPEVWQDVITELCPRVRLCGKGGAVSGC